MHLAIWEASGRVVGWDNFTYLRVCEDAAYAEKFHQAWHARVRKAVPYGQLLEFEMGKHGWKELARFFGVPAPDVPFPHANSAEEFGFILNIHRVLAVLTLLIPGLLLRFLLRRYFWGNAARLKGE
jgi:hypothetical protein